MYNVDVVHTYRFEFSIVRETPPLNAFQVDPNAGRLSTTRPLDREQTSMHQLLVRVTDVDQPEMTSQVNVTVFVADKNDNAPVITYPSPENNTIEVEPMQSNICNYLDGIAQRH